MSKKDFLNILFLGTIRNKKIPFEKKEVIDTMYQEFNTLNQTISNKVDKDTRFDMQMNIIKNLIKMY